jgi:hypothetical protein
LSNVSGRLSLLFLVRLIIKIRHRLSSIDLFNRLLRRP